MTDLMTEKELAKYLNLSVAACRKWRTKGHGPKFLKLGSAVRYQRQDVDQWIATRPQGGLSDRGMEGGVQ